MKFRSLVFLLGFVFAAQFAQAAQVNTGRGSYEILSAEVVSAGASCYLVAVGFESRTPLRDCFSIGCFFDPEEADQMAAQLRQSNELVLTVKYAHDCKVNYDNDWEIE